MAQTIGQISAADLVVSTSTDGTAFTDHSGTIISINTTGGTRLSGEAYTALGDNPVTTVGKATPVDITITALYTEITGEFYKAMRALETARTPVWLRMMPKGGQTGETVFTAGPGVITNVSYPNLDEANSGTPILTGLTWHGPRWSETVAA